MDIITYNKIKNLDLADYTPFCDTVFIASDTTAPGGSRILKQINGAGCLDLALAMFEQIKGYLVIVLDGVAICRSSSKNLYNSAVGMYRACDVISPPEGVTVAVMSPLGIANVDFNCNQRVTNEFSPDASTPKNVVTSDSLYFKESLVIYFESASSTARSLHFTCRGKIKTK